MLRPGSGLQHEKALEDEDQECRNHAHHETQGHGAHQAIPERSYGGPGLDHLFDRRNQFLESLEARDRRDEDHDRHKTDEETENEGNTKKVPEFLRIGVHQHVLPDKVCWVRRYLNDDLLFIFFGKELQGDGRLTPMVESDECVGRVELVGGIKLLLQSLHLLLCLTQSCRQRASAMQAVQVDHTQQPCFRSLSCLALPFLRLGKFLL
mmetsp:Transcript_7080/g.14739  ORF Transcript_7080/g.14739 Transcript_7080/m.14739 type:complete len:208 (-) Transcript_7080:1105-1728(-)